jgi:segregation and condensation protein B
MTDTEALQVIEALLFVADEPVTTSELAQLLELPAADIERLVGQLSTSYAERDAGLVVREVAGGWRLATHQVAAPFLDRFVDENRRARLTQAALETLSIIAYRQPISRAQLAEIRGVSTDGVVRTLIARGLVEEVGRDPGPGLAVLYGTSSEFLERLGLKSLADLPPLPQFMPDAKAVERMESGLGPGV